MIYRKLVDRFLYIYITSTRTVVWDRTSACWLGARDLLGVMERSPTLLKLLECLWEGMIDRL